MKKILFMLLAAMWFSAGPVAAQQSADGNITSAGTCGAAPSCVILDNPNAAGSASILITGTWSATVQFEGSADGTSAPTGTWDSLSCIPMPSGTAATSATGNDTWQCNTAALSAVRVRASAYTSGTVVVKIRWSNAIAKSIFGPSEGGAAIGGSGTANTIPKFTAASTVGDSQITDTGTLITMPGTTRFSGLTASVPVFTNSTKDLISGTQTGTGTVVVTQASPTITTPTLSGATAAGTINQTVAGNTIGHDIFCNSTGTGYCGQEIHSTGGDVYHLIDTSTGSVFGNGNYSYFVGTVGATNLGLGTNTVPRLTIAATTGAANFTGSLGIGSGTPILKHLSATATLDFANLAAIGCEDLTITVTGAALGNTVALGVPNASIVANGNFFGWVSAADTVSVRFCTVTSGNPASGTFRADVWQH